MSMQRGALETSRAATGRARDKTEIGVGLAIYEETRWINSQEGHRMEPTGEVQEGDPRIPEGRHTGMVELEEKQLT